MSSSASESPVDPFVADSFSESSMEITEFSHIWTIRNFSFCVNEKLIKSPAFGAAIDPGTRWSLELKPRGMRKGTKDYVSVNLRRLSSKPAELHAITKVSLLNAEGRTLHTMRSQALRTYTLSNPFWGWSDFTPLDSLLESDSGNLPSDKLILRCEVSYTLGISDIPSQESQIQSGCNSTGFLRELHGNPMLSDVVLSYDDKEIHAHRVVLAARSPILKAVFEQDHKQGKTSHIDILDLEEETLQNLLRFIYTGESEVPDNMRNLLDTIDKHARRRS